MLSADLQDVIATWIWRIESWVPPGTARNELCIFCLASPHPETAGIQEWPHDIVHPLVEALEEKVESMTRGYSDDYQTDDGCSPAETPEARAKRLETYDAHARMLVRRELTRYRDEIEVTLTHLVGARIDDFVASQTTQLVNQFERMS